MMLGSSVDQFGFPVEEPKQPVKASKPMSEELDRVIIQEHIRLEREKQMKASKLLEEIEAKLAKLNEARASDEDEMPMDDEPQDDEQGLYEVVLDEETLERFADGLLTVLGELESEKAIPAIEDADTARDALLAVVRQLFQKKSTLAKMSRKFARFGAKQFLKRQRQQITKSI